MGFPATPSSFCSALHFIFQSAPPTILPDPIINVITVPPKIWRKKAASNYKPLVYNDVDEDLYSFKPFGKCVKRSTSWKPRLRSDLIHWNKSLDSPELERDFRMGDQADDPTRHSVLSIIKSNWDSFCARGVSRPVLDFEFCIDTGNSPLFVVASRSTDTTKGK